MSLSWFGPQADQIHPTPVVHKDAAETAAETAAVAHKRDADSSAERSINGQRSMSNGVVWIPL